MNRETLTVRGSSKRNLDEFIMSTYPQFPASRSHCVKLDLIAANSRRPRVEVRCYSPSIKFIGIYANVHHSKSL